MKIQGILKRFKISEGFRTYFLYTEICTAINIYSIHIIEASSRGLAVMYPTQTNMALGSRPTVGIRSQMLVLELKYSQRHPPKLQGTGGNGDKIA